MSSDKDESSKSLTFLSGIIVGGIAGTLLGLFLAPKSGTEMRHQFSENMTDAQSKTKQLLDEARVSLEQSVDKATKNLESTVKRVTEAFNAGRKAALEDLDSETVESADREQYSANLKSTDTEISQEDK